MTSDKGSQGVDPALGLGDEGGLTSDEVRSRAIAGSGVVVMRGLGIRVLGLLGNVVLARLLLPRDFGIVAFGATLMLFGSFFADVGMGPALIRRAEPPTEKELRSLLGFNVVVTTILGVLTAAVAWPFGSAGRVAAVMLLSMPLMAFRVPGAITLERRLEFHPLVVVDLAEALVYNAWAIVTVVLGWGVWGLATAYIVRSFVASALMMRVSGVALLRPTWSTRTLKGLLGFGVRFQAASLVGLVRDEGVNVGTAAIGGVTTLGFWSLAKKIMGLGDVFYQAVFRVSFPAMSRLVGAGQDVGAIIERALAVSGVIAGALLAAIGASAEVLVPVVFGDQWNDTVPIIPAACLGMILVAPLSLAGAGFLYAKGDASTVLRGQILHTLAFFVVTFPLLRPLGPLALGLGQLAAACTEAVVLRLGLARLTDASLLRPQAVPTFAAITAGAGGWVFAASLDPTPLSVVAVVAAAEGIFIAILALLRPSLLCSTIRLGVRALRAAIHRGPRQPVGSLTP